jgi:hypothetical protein
MYYRKMQGRGLEKMLGRGPCKERRNAQKYKMYYAKRGAMP